MRDLIIKPACQIDWAYIREKLRRYALDANDAQWHHFFVAKTGDKIIGFGRIIYRGDYVELASLGVDYYYRKQGVGKKILAFLIKEAKRAYPGKCIYGVTHRPGFLRPFGFKEVKEAPVELENKRRNECILDASKIKIMRIMG
jgi:N-acetylglutamate synthase-like GNAT family acetyltransferase